MQDVITTFRKIKSEAYLTDHGTTRRRLAVVVVVGKGIEIRIGYVVVEKWLDAGRVDLIFKPMRSGRFSIPMCELSEELTYQTIVRFDRWYGLTRGQGWPIGPVWGAGVKVSQS